MDAVQFAAMMDLLRQTLTAAVQGAARPAGPDPRLQRPTKMTAEDKPEAYLEVFEAMATSAGWAQAQWASYLLPQLTGEAQAAARTLSPERMMDYPALKAAILNRVGATPEGYRRKFREERFSAEEHPRTIAHRLKDYAMGWLNPDASTKARIVEVIVVERFLECLAPAPRLSAPLNWNSEQGGLALPTNRREDNKRPERKSKKIILKKERGKCGIIGQPQYLL
ncbi:SCAN domain-containing protein 1-like [Acipenser ruthenus]|uniref:SCAN domain-containing protein 1-like n=1 Tax=Acipenser ruthenus TaxID=7906 RepID=UPI00274139ED|nr:SCAN domain-containing protein 1-like [Acipenser ruthenus]